MRRAREVCGRLRAAINAQPWTRISPDLAVTIRVGLADTEAFESVSEGLADVDRRLRPSPPDTAFELTLCS